MNQVNLIGNIGGEPEVRSFNSGAHKVARFSIAINGYSKDKDKIPAPTWVPCEMWDASVERLLKCQEKGKLLGRKIQVTGSLALNTYDKTVGGQTMTVRKLYVKVQSFQLLNRGAEEAPDDTAEAAAPMVVHAEAVMA